MKVLLKHIEIIELVAAILGTVYLVPKVIKYVGLALHIAFHLGQIIDY